MVWFKYIYLRPVCVETIRRTPGVTAVFVNVERLSPLSEVSKSQHSLTCLIYLCFQLLGSVHWAECRRCFVGQQVLNVFLFLSAHQQNEVDKSVNTEDLFFFKSDSYFKFYSKDQTCPDNQSRLELWRFYYMMNLFLCVKREMQEAWGLKVFDRYSLVLHIFRRNARTKEAKLQISLAEIPLLR